MGAHAVVIGSGIGGSAATLLLAHAGIPVTLVEKNRRIGGSCSGYEKQGFHIDIGTHMFCRGDKGPLGDVLRRAGSPGAIRFVRTRDIAELRFLDPDEPSKVRGVAVPADVSRMPRFAFEIARALQLSVTDAMRAARLFTYILSMSDAEVASWDHRSIEDFLEPFTDHAPTIGVFGFLLGLYFILPYWEVSAGEALWCFRRMARDNALSYPKGGSIAIPETYVRLAKENGAQVRTGTGVKRVVVREGRVAGVELSDGTVIPATVVISTSSVRTTVSKLVGAEHFPDSYVDRAMKIRGSYIAVQAKIGLSKKLVEPGCIVGGVGDGVDLARVGTNDMKDMFAHLLRGEVPPIVPFYCPVPTNFDPDLAPPGHQLLTLCAVAPTSDVALTSPPAAWEEAMMRTIRRVVPGLDEHVVFIDTFDVKFIESWIGKEFGPAVSTGQTPDQVGKKRPPVYTPLRGLYLAGCNAGARGVGTELAAASAMECVDRVLTDLGRDLVAPGSERSPAETAARLIARAAAMPLAWATRA
ncbi:MAG: all-trans-retinol 13,14-reductase [Myxococcales bacterium]|nr:all-trans-retinol 13,14-reductase [Myxococcales bacterium]